MNADKRRWFGSTAAILNHQSALPLTSRHPSEFVMPLFSHAESVDADLPTRSGLTRASHDERYRPTVASNIAQHNSYLRSSAFICG
jgi:hypothetical protein